MLNFGSTKNSYTASRATHSAPTELSIGSRDVEVTVSKPSVIFPKTNWEAGGNFTNASYNTFTLVPDGKLSQIKYTGELGAGVESVRFGFTYTENTLAGDHWFGICVDGWWHQLFLNASHESALPYMAIYAPGATTPFFTRIDNRIPREDIPLGVENIFEIKFKESSVELWINEKMIYNFTGYTHSAPSEISIGSRDVEIMITNPTSNLRSANSDKEWIANSAISEDGDNTWSAKKGGSTGILKYNGNIKTANSLSFEFNYENSVSAGDHYVGWRIGKPR